MTKGNRRLIRKLRFAAFLSILFIFRASVDIGGINGYAQDAVGASPRLADLKKEIDAGNRPALDAFWGDIERRGAPLVEPLAGDDLHLLVTFLWRAKEETRNVVVVGGVAGYEFSENQMSRLGDTDLWYRTYKVRNDARFSYNLSPNDSLVPFRKIDVHDRKAVLQRVSSFKTDQFNRRTYLGLPPTSLLELPGAPPQPWINRSPDVAAGKVEEKRIKSAILGNERRAWVYTPPGYRTDGDPYGLIVLFDGIAYTTFVPTPVILDNLLGRSLVPPMVAVVLDNPTPTSRDEEMPCNTRFADFLAKEAVPWIRENYHVTADPGKTIVVGSSYGGLAATYAGFRHPEIFGNVISQSASLWWKPEKDEEHEWLTRQFVSSPKLALRFYMDVGLFETGSTPDDGPSQIVVNRHLRDVLQSKGYFVHYREFTGGHEYLNWRGTLADAFLALIGRESEKQQRK